MNHDRLSDYLKKAGEPPYRMQQVLRAVYIGASGYEEISPLPTALRKRLAAEVPILSFTSDVVRVSGDALAHKARVRLTDGKMVETVLMQSKPGHWSVCVSSQVGCALGCNFCATGLMGFSRNLTTEEITDQVLFWRQYLKRYGRRGDLPSSLSSAKGRCGNAAISNVVFMGMGEPLLNFNVVKQSIQELSDPDRFGLGRRSIAVSTAGVVPGILRFAEELPQVHLAVSLHAANNLLRARLVPLNKSYPLETLAAALRSYLFQSNRKVFLEYVLLQGENDQAVHARELTVWIRRVGSAHKIHVNLIVWNPTHTPHEASSRERARWFKELLKRSGISVTIRKNLGREVEGACGQLMIPK